MFIVELDPDSAFYAVVGVFVLAELLRNWDRIWNDVLSRRDRVLLWLTGFFVLLPIFVLIHEFGHLLAIWLFGGSLEELVWGIYSGHVASFGVYTAAEDWFIAVAGSLLAGIVGLGLAAVGYLATSMRPPVRYLLLASGVVAFIDTAVIYPVLWIPQRFGDWTVIYDFRETPALAAVAAVVHVAVLALLVQWWARGSLKGIVFVEEE